MAESPTPSERVQHHRHAPGTTSKLFPDLGHMGPITHASTINAAIAAFLAS